MTFFGPHSLLPYEPHESGKLSSVFYLTSCVHSKKGKKRERELQYKDDELLMEEEKGKDSHWFYWQWR